MTDFLRNITLGSWLTAAVIILIRLLFCKVLSPRAKYLLWMLLALRLCLPVLPESQLSFQNLTVFDQTSSPAVITVQETPDTTPEAEREVESEKTMTAQDTSPAIINQTSEPVNSTKFSMDGFCLMIWFIGMMLCVGVYAGLWLRTGWQLRMAVHVDDSETVRCFLNVRRALGVKGEIRLCYGQECLIGGLMRPTLLIPREFTGAQLEAALTHELMHYKSRDLWIAAFWRLLCCVYWFNPVVWICFHWARLDCEKACDQRVLELQNVSPAVYAQLLFEEAKQKMRVGTTAFGHGNIRSRIKSVVDFKKPAVWMTLLSILAALVVLVCTMTGAVTETPWKWAKNLRAFSVTEMELQSGGQAVILNDDQIDMIIRTIRSLDEADFTEDTEPAGIVVDTALTITCGNESYFIYEIGPEEGQFLLEFQEEQWCFDSEALDQKLEDIQDGDVITDLSPAMYPLSILFEQPNDALIAAYEKSQSENDTSYIYEALDELMGDYITEDFKKQFASGNGIGEFFEYVCRFNLMVHCEELKVTEDDTEENRFHYEAVLIINDDTENKLNIRGAVSVDSEYRATSIYAYGAALTEFYQSLSDEPVYTEFLAFEPVEPENAEAVDVYIPNIGWSTFLECDEDIVSDEIEFSCDVPDIVTFTPEQARLKATGVGDCSATLSYQGLVMKLSIHVFSRATDSVTIIPPSESAAPEITVLPHTDGEEPEVSTLPQEEWKPQIQKIKDTLYQDYNTTGDIYQSDAALVALLEAASDTSIVSLTLSSGDVIWRVPGEDCAGIAKQISASSSIVVDAETEYGYFYLRNDNTYALIKNALHGLAMCEFLDNLTYDPDDPVYFWRAVHYSAGGEYGNLNDEKSWVTYSESEILEISKVLFSGNETIPEIPETWSDVYEKTSDGNYRMKTGEYGLAATYMDSISYQGNGVYAADVTLMKNGETAGYWYFEIGITNGVLSVIGMSTNKIKN